MTVRPQWATSENHRPGQLVHCLTQFQGPRIVEAMTLRSTLDILSCCIRMPGSG